MKFAFEVIAAKKKGKPSVEDAPSQTPMAPRGGQRRNPSTDQKSVRRQMAKKAGIEEQVERMVRNGEPWDSDCPNPFCRDGVHTECSGVGCDCPCHAYGFSEMGFFGSRKVALDGFWEAIDSQLAEATKAKSAADVMRIFRTEANPYGDPGITNAKAFFGGSGGDATLYGALMKAGWTWVKGDDIFWVMKAPNGDLITYVEGDIYEGDQMGSQASLRVVAKHSCVYSQETNHSDDIIAVYHGETEPTYICGYHEQRWGVPGTGRYQAETGRTAKVAMDGQPLSAPNSPYGAVPADAQQQGMGEMDDNAEPAPMGGRAAAKTAGYLTVNGQDFEYDYEPDPDWNMVGDSPSVIVKLYDGDTGEFIDAMGGVEVDFEVSDHGNTNAGPEAERYIKEVATDMAQEHLSRAASLAARSGRFVHVPAPSNEYTAAVEAARRALTSGARDASVISAEFGR